MLENFVHIRVNLSWLSAFSIEVHESTLVDSTIEIEADLKATWKLLNDVLCTTVSGVLGLEQLLLMN